jgi:hypothetical protein
VGFFYEFIYNLAVSLTVHIAGDFMGELPIKPFAETDLFT